jgi:hypothetical protein
MKVVVSISLGSSKRNSRVETTLLGTPIILERIGVDGDRQRARRLFLEMDSKVDAFGFGGADMGFWVDNHWQRLHSVASLVDGVKTPVADGGRLRRVIERKCVQRMTPLTAPISPKRVLVCTAAARYDLARSFVDAGYDFLFGDLGFAAGLPLPVRSLRSLHILARVLFPIFARLPFEWLYPTGEKQQEIHPKFSTWFQWATVFADDFHYVRRHLPDRLDGKIIVTNTTTAQDVELLRQRGLRTLVTTTPRLDGRSFGTNVIEAGLIAISGKGRPLTPDEIRAMLHADDLTPSVLELNPAR